MLRVGLLALALLSPVAVAAGADVPPPVVPPPGPIGDPVLAPAPPAPAVGPTDTLLSPVSLRTVIDRASPQVPCDTSTYAPQVIAVVSGGDPLNLPFVLRPEIGFAYLVPRGSKRLGVAAEPHDLDYGAVLYPKIDLIVKYKTSNDANVPEQSFVVSAAYLRLDGDLSRQTTMPDGIARVESHADLELTVADLIGARWGWPKDQTFKWWEAGVSIRYASLNQRFSWRSANGTTETSELTATQSFSGIGVSGVVGFRVPLTGLPEPVEKDRLTLYGNARGSLLAGDNRKTSTFVATGRDAVTVELDDRDLIPIGEVEVGVAWGRATRHLWPSFREANDPPPLVGIKVAAVAQFWGDVGHISAARPVPNRFNGGNLILYGGAVTFYLDL